MDRCLQKRKKICKINLWSYFKDSVISINSTLVVITKIHYFVCVEMYSFIFFMTIELSFFFLVSIKLKLKSQISPNPKLYVD